MDHACRRGPRLESHAARLRAGSSVGNRLRPGYLQPFLITILIRAEEIKFSMGIQPSQRSRRRENYRRNPSTGPASRGTWLRRLCRRGVSTMRRGSFCNRGHTSVSKVNLRASRPDQGGVRVARKYQRHSHVKCRRRSGFEGLHPCELNRLRGHFPPVLADVAEDKKSSSVFFFQIPKLVDADLFAVLRKALVSVFNFLGRRHF